MVSQKLMVDTLGSKITTMIVPKGFIAVDLDGTLTDTAHFGNKYFPKGETPDFDSYYREIRHGVIYQPMVDVLNALIAAGYEWELWTARQSQRGRDITEKWLEHNDLKPRAIRMNPHGDVYVPAVTIKSQFVADFGQPALAFDDQDDLIAMYAELNIPSFKVVIPEYG